MAAGVKELLNVGIGFTVTVTFWVFEQPLAVMVQAQTTLTGLAVVLTKVSLGLADWAVVTAALLIPVTAALVQVKVEPAEALVGVQVKAELEQIAGGVKVLLKVGVGFTVTVTFWVFEQPLAVIVQAQTTLTGLAVVLTKVSLGLADWAVVTAALLIPATAALVQVKVVPAVALVGVQVNAELLQMAAGVNELLSVGIGFIEIDPLVDKLTPYEVVTERV